MTRTLKTNTKEKLSVTLQAINQQFNKRIV